MTTITLYVDIVNFNLNIGVSAMIDMTNNPVVIKVYNSLGI